MQPSNWRRIIPWTILVIVFGFIVWSGVVEEQQPDALEGTTVVVVNPSANSAFGSPVPFTWMVRAPVGASATSTAVRFGTQSQAGALDTDVAPSQTTYETWINDYERGAFPLPREFSSALALPAPGTYYYRAHATIDGKQYWSPEYQLLIQ
jgi:hypothetical protein